MKAASGKDVKQHFFIKKTYKGHIWSEQPLIL